MGLLASCSRCSAWTARGFPCPKCHFAGEAPPGKREQRNVVAEFKRRRSIHGRNYIFHMAIMFLLGTVGLVAAGLWFWSIYGGDTIATVLCMRRHGFEAFTMGLPVEAVLFFLAGGLQILLHLLGRKFPIELCCPSCNQRLDEFGMTMCRCPGCLARLR